jgi:hypothetical protein
MFLLHIPCNENHQNLRKTENFSELLLYGVVVIYTEVNLRL